MNQTSSFLPSPLRSTRNRSPGLPALTLATMAGSSLTASPKTRSNELLLGLLAVSGGCHVRTESPQPDARIEN